MPTIYFRMITISYPRIIITPHTLIVVLYIFLETPATAERDYPREAISSGSNSIINLIPEIQTDCIRNAPHIIPAPQERDRCAAPSDRQTLAIKNNQDRMYRSNKAILVLEHSIIWLQYHDSDSIMREFIKSSKVCPIQSSSLGFLFGHWLHDETFNRDQSNVEWLAMTYCKSVSDWNWNQEYRWWCSCEC